MVPAHYEAGVVSTLRSIPWIAIGRLLAVAIVIIFLLANVLWLIDRRRNREPSRGYLSTIGEELWGAMLVVATLNVERDAPGIKRVTILLMWLIGVVMIAQLTATVTSVQTVARLQSTIRGPDDLPGKTIASVPGTVAADYLTERGLPFTTVTYGPDANSDAHAAGRSRRRCSTPRRCSTGLPNRERASYRSSVPLSGRRNTPSRSPLGARFGNRLIEHCLKFTRTAPTRRSTQLGSQWCNDREAAASAAGFRGPKVFPYETDCLVAIIALTARSFGAAELNRTRGRDWGLGSSHRLSGASTTIRQFRSDSPRQFAGNVRNHECREVHVGAIAFSQAAVTAVTRTECPPSFAGKT